MGIDLRSKILGAQDIKEKPLRVDEWDADILLRGMNGKQRARVMGSCADKKGNVDYEKMYPLLVINGVYDPETNKRVFSDADKDAVGEKSGGVVERIAIEVMQLSGLNEQAVEEMRKN